MRLTVGQRTSRDGRPSVPRGGHVGDPAAIADPVGMMAMHGRRSARAVPGIDPGLDGTVAAIGLDGVAAILAPELVAGRDGRRHHGAALAQIPTVRPFEPAVIEAAGPMSEPGMASTFRSGVGYGLWPGLLAASGIAHEAVTPRVWKKSVLAGRARTESDAITLANHHFPAVPLLATPRSRIPHDGISGALGLAAFARRLVVGAADPRRWAVAGAISR